MMTMNISRHEFTKSYLKNASEDVLEAMYQKIHNFLWDEKYFYKKTTYSEFDHKTWQVYLKDVLQTLVNRLIQRKKDYIKRQKVKDSFIQNEKSQYEYTATDAHRDVLWFIPLLEKHPEILQKRITKSLSDQEKKQQHALLPKHIRCVTGTKRLLETILSAKNNIFVENKDVDKEIAPKVIQLDLFKDWEDNYDKELEQNKLSKTIPLNDIEELYKDDDGVYEYPWQKYNNR